jgi:hypothetical protein
VEGDRAVAHKDIESVLQEVRRFPPPADFAVRAQLKAADLEALRARAAESSSVTLKGCCQCSDSRASSAQKPT